MPTPSLITTGLMYSLRSPLGNTLPKDRVVPAMIGSPNLLA